MEKDDYFYIVYRILSYLYECFKEGASPRLDDVGPEVLGINEGYWVNVMTSLAGDGFIKGFKVSKSIGGTRIDLGGLSIKNAGIEYLADNAMMETVRRNMAPKAKKKK